VQRAAFDPASTEQAFVLSVPDGCEVALLPGLLQRIQAAAPRVRIQSVSFDRRHVMRQLEDAEIDLAIGVFATNTRYLAELLYVERHACLYNPKLIRHKPPIGLQEYLAYPHILISHTGGAVGVVDLALGERNLKRTVLASTPYAHLIPFLLQEVKAFGIVPRRLAERVAKPAGLAVCPPPIDTGDYRVSMIWHPRSQADPAHTWLRALIKAVAAA
jgi:DNA-binding transcriptional LysR family regulator